MKKKRKFVPASIRHKNKDGDPRTKTPEFWQELIDKENSKHKEHMVSLAYLLTDTNTPENKKQYKKANHLINKSKAKIRKYTKYRLDTIKLKNQQESTVSTNAFIEVVVPGAPNRGLMNVAYIDSVRVAPKAHPDNPKVIIGYDVALAMSSGLHEFTYPKLADALKMYVEIRNALEGAGVPCHYHAIPDEMLNPPEPTVVEVEIEYEAAAKLEEPNSSLDPVASTNQDEEGELVPAENEYPEPVEESPIQKSTGTHQQAADRIIQRNAEEATTREEESNELTTPNAETAEVTGQDTEVQVDQSRAETSSVVQESHTQDDPAGTEPHIDSRRRSENSDLDF